MFDMIQNLPLGHLKITAGNSNRIMQFMMQGIAEGKKLYCMPLNLTKYVLSKTDLKLRKAILSADLVLSDGISIVWLSRRAGYKNVYRLTGVDFAQEIISRSTQYNWKLFFFGATEENLSKAIHKLKERFGKINIVGLHHGYFKKNEIKDIINYINYTEADILFIALGFPQREYFIYDNFEKINAKLSLPVGGTFDIWADVKKRSPNIIQNMGLEWLYRSFYDKNKAKLIAKYGLIFLNDLIFYRNK